VFVEGPVPAQNKSKGRKELLVHTKQITLGGRAMAFGTMECRYHAIVSDESQEEEDRKRHAAVASSLKKVDTKVVAGSRCNSGRQIFFTIGCNINKTIKKKRNNSGCVRVLCREEIRDGTRR
jgi:hypothetical protein